jgi:hypothetical protein
MLVGHPESQTKIILMHLSTPITTYPHETSNAALRQWRAGVFVFVQFLARAFR